MKTYVIGDIHGCDGALKKILARIGTDFSINRLICMGDYIDRGPDSAAVLEILLALRERYGADQVTLLRGNHEDMAMRYRDGELARWMRNGAAETLSSLSAHGKSIDDYLPAMAPMPLMAEDAHFFYVHAGFRPGVPPFGQTDQDKLWIREDFFTFPTGLNKKVIFGHTATNEMGWGVLPKDFGDKLCIDTGCVLGGRLTCLEIEEDRVVRVYQACEEADSEVLTWDMNS